MDLRRLGGARRSTLGGGWLSRHGQAAALYPLKKIGESSRVLAVWFRGRSCPAAFFALRGLLQSVPREVEYFGGHFEGAIGFFNCVFVYPDLSPPLSPLFSRLFNADERAGGRALPCTLFGGREKGASLNRGGLGDGTIRHL